MRMVAALLIVLIVAGFAALTAVGPALLLRGAPTPAAGVAPTSTPAEPAAALPTTPPTIPVVVAAVDVAEPALSAPATEMLSLPTDLPTAAPIPTEMEAPTATPIVILARAVDAANLRAGPSTAFARIGAVDAQDPLMITGRSSAGDWYQLQDGAWIAAFLVEVAPSDLSILENISTKSLEPGTVPAGWTKHALIANDVTFAMPPGWYVDKELGDGINFAPVDDSPQTFGILTIPTPDPPIATDVELIRYLKLRTIDIMDKQEFKVIYTQEGVLEAANSAAYVVAHFEGATIYESGAIYEALLLFENESILLMLISMGTDDIAPEVVTVLSQVANSVVVPYAGISVR